MSWKDNIKKAEKLNSYDETNAFATVLVELAVLKNVSDVLRFYEKPYNYQKLYEDLLKLVEEHFGEPASITEIVDVEELSDKAFEFIQNR
jgi:hypothetical protein|tara:strand:- start:127 stop:396 length:270 start_codon:yes stop_codon:yes gene_type:complete